MNVADILRTKGAAVTTVSAGASALVVAQRLRGQRIGAMLVSDDGHSIEGIISERDLAYGLATHAGNLPNVPVSELMTKEVITCSPRDSVSEIAKVMTQRRIRHLPVQPMTGTTRCCSSSITAIASSHMIVAGTAAPLKSGTATIWITMPTTSPRWSRISI